jgi:hypothetical protein
MSRRFAAALLAAVSVAVLASGCSGSGDDRLPPADDAVAWAGRLCSSLQPLASLKGETPNFDRNNPAESRQAMSQYFQRAAEAAAESVHGLQEAGPSPIPGGDDVAGKLHGALLALQQAYNNARSKVETVDPNDPVGMGTQLPGILSSLVNATDNASLKTIGVNPALNDAVRKAPSCALGTPGGAPGN